MPEDKITIVFAQHWSWDIGEGAYDWDIYYDKPKVCRVFYKLDDALDYINSVPNQHVPGLSYDADIDAGYDSDGFYLYQEQYDIY